MNWWQAVLVGLAVGVFIGTPIMYFILKLYKDTRQRISVKKAVEKGEFLQPIDKRDYDVETWKDKIQPDENYVKNLDKKILHKINEEEDGKEVTTD